MTRLSTVALMSVLFAAGAASGCDESTGFVDAGPTDATPDPGTISFTWTVLADGEPTTCQAVGGIVTSMGVRLENSPTGVNEGFSCGSLQGRTGPLIPGPYTLTFSLTGSGGIIARSPLMSGVVVVTGQDTALGNIEFDVVAAP